MLTCKEVARLVASDELAAAGWMRRLSARLHFLICRHCRAYAAQIRSLGDLARKGWQSSGAAGDGRRRQEDDLLARASGKPPSADD